MTEQKGNWSQWHSFKFPRESSAVIPAKAEAMFNSEAGQ